jgi:CheY-like chemotaxis protein/anti-sigma regulatory factor (Ser/Thr protein kinase)
MPSILVVDDSNVDRRLAVGLLERIPECTIYEASDGRKALEQLELHLPDLVVTDMLMPNMNGLELVSEVREQFPLVPIILMTSQGSEEIAVAALQKGASSYVPKRVLAADLLEVVDRVLTASHETRGRARLMNRMLRCDYEFTLENDLALIMAAAAFLREDAQRQRICSRSECLRLGVAIEEALLNAFYHGNLEISSELREHDHRAYHDLANRRCQELPYRDRRLFIAVAVTPASARYTIRDEGPGFDLASLPNPTDPANLDRPCGRGILLMRTFMDRVTFNEAGNEVVLLKNRAHECELLGEEEA